MTTMQSKNVNEETFDLRFGQKERLDYSHISGKPSRRDRQVMRLLLEYGIEGRRCLDIGPGTGRWLQFLKDHGADELTAVDLSQEALNRAAAMGATCQKVDIEHEPLDFPTDTFEIALAFMVLEHLRDPHTFVREVLRVTKQSGLVLMTVPNIASLQSRIRLVWGRLPVAVAQDPTHVRFYTVRELTTLFGSHGANVEVIPTSFSLHPFNHKRWRVPSNRLLTGLDDHRLFITRARS